MLANIKDFIDGDNWELIDGLDEIPEEWQEKLKKAVEDGHVPDEDWRGVRRSLCGLFHLLTDQFPGYRVQSPRYEGLQEEDT